MSCPLLFLCFVKASQHFLNVVLYIYLELNVIISRTFNKKKNRQMNIRTATVA